MEKDQVEGGKGDMAQGGDALKFSEYFWLAFRSIDTWSTNICITQSSKTSPLSSDLAT